MFTEEGHAYQIRVNYVGTHAHSGGGNYSQYTSAFLFMVPGINRTDRDYNTIMINHARKTYFIRFTGENVKMSLMIIHFGLGLINFSNYSFETKIQLSLTEWTNRNRVIHTLLHCSTCI